MQAVSESRTESGRDLFSRLKSCLLTTTFILLNIFSPVETISLKIWDGLLSWRANCALPVSVHGSKTSLA